MIHANEGKLVNMVAATAASTATQSLVLDTKGYDQANFYVNVGTHATDGTTLTDCFVGESDTSTVISNMTDIVALTGGTETSSSAGYVLPLVAAAGFGTIIELQLDCRKSKRYVACQVTPGDTTVNVGIVGRLTRSKKSADTAAEKAVSGTNVFHSTNATTVLAVATA